MGDKTGIQWTDATWNPIVGCSIISPACTNCYAMAQAARIQRMTPGSHYEDTTKEVNGKPVWSGVLKQAPEHILLAPLRWKKPRRIFVNSMSDLLHESVPEKWIDEVFAVMALCPQHTFQVLTKRPARMREYISGQKFDVPILGAKPLERVHLEAAAHMRGDGGIYDALKEAGNVYSLYLDRPWPLPNVWLGVTAERQQEADERVPDLLATPAAVRFVSIEPMLGEIDLRSICTGHFFMNSLTGTKYHDVPAGMASPTEDSPRIDQVICGGESGPGARPMHPDWARRLRDQCAAAGVAFFFKQWGEWAPRDDWSGLSRAETMTAIMRDGRRCPEDTPPQEIGAHRMARVGKLRAGRLLDGREHNALPGARP